MPTRCTAHKADGTPCRAWAVRGSDPPRCPAHRGPGGPVDPQPPCLAGREEPGPASRSDEPPGREPPFVTQPALFSPPDALPPGTPKGEGPAAEGDAAAIAAAIANLQRRLQQLSDYIDQHFATMSRDSYVKLANLQGMLTSRLGRLMRDRLQVAGGADSELDAALAAALDELGKEWGIEL